MGYTATARRWAKVVSEYESSGLTIRVFADTKGVNYHTFQYWRGRLRLLEEVEAAKSAPSFVEVSVTSGPATCSSLEIAFDRIGCRVSVDRDTDLTLLRTVVETLC